MTANNSAANEALKIQNLFMVDGLNVVITGGGSGMLLPTSIHCLPQLPTASSLTFNQPHTNHL
jgi:hypothetical protein